MTPVIHQRVHKAIMDLIVTPLLFQLSIPAALLLKQLLTIRQLVPLNGCHLILMLRSLNAIFKKYTPG